MADTEFHLLYLHGFLSSPQSTKAQQTVAYCEQQGMADVITVPLMLDGPAATIEQLESIIADLPARNLGLMGSSLGGYYGTYLAEKFNLPAVLINPAVEPFELWEEHLGAHKNYYVDHVHIVTREHIDELRSLHCPRLNNPENFMVLLQTADEVLDYRLAATRFAKSRLEVQQGGDHSFQNFEAELPGIFDFLLSRID